MLELSVIIPTFNRKSVLERTFASLVAQDLDPKSYEVIVVVDGSTDGTAEMLREWKPECAFRVLEKQNRGPSAARNDGVRAAIGRLILFLDDDLICGPDLFRKHCESHTDGQTRVVHGPIYIAPESVNTVIRYISERGYERYYDSLDPAMELRYPDDFAPSIAVLSSMVNSSMPRDLLLACGGFDEQIRVAEDLELGLRLWKARVPFRFHPSAVVREYYVKTSREYLKWQSGAVASGDLLVARKHPEYRKHSSLASFAETSPIKKWARSLIMRLPLSLTPLLTAHLRLEKSLYRFGWYQRTAERSLNAAQRLERMRSSLRAVGTWATLTSEFDRRLTVLMYHHVGPERPGALRSMTVSPQQFQSHLNWLKRRGYSSVKPSDWLRWLRTGTGVPKKAVLITFDDAYDDTAKYAFPLLRQYGFDAAVFVVTGRIGGTNSWDEAQGIGTLKIMDEGQIRHWARNGIEFGAHSRTHPNLTELFLEERQAEIAGSKNDLSSLLGSQVVAFAYPFGEHDDLTRSVVREHFDLGFSSEEGINYLRTDPFLLRRTYIGPDHSIPEFALLVRWGSLKRINKWRARLRVRSRLKKAFKYFGRSSEPRTDE
jgi:peptidoglycan/xylan/chitin deacetylase (PgdA/CDA1 family)/GT2 family glycosyltransferase